VHGKGLDLVLESQPTRRIDSRLQKLTHPSQGRTRGICEARLPRGIAPLQSVQASSREPERCKQFIEILEAPTAEQRHGTTEPVRKFGEMLNQSRIDVDSARACGIRDQRAINIKKYSGHSWQIWQQASLSVVH
jgi:hypothetical protein